ncbi:MAG: hypothetical protein AB1805_01785 [Nitrospirota bacterium]
MMRMRTITSIALLLLSIPVLFAARAAEAAGPVCARVKIEILQELALERIAFDAKLIITNNLPDQPLENVSVTLDITDENGNDASAMFYVRIMSMHNINAVDGAGRIAPQVASEVHWILIPSPGAGGITPLGKIYRVGGMINFMANGNPQEISMLPDSITVKPQPELLLDYFLPREVWADDPFTGTVEAPIPFALGVRTKNAGYGVAAKMSISSGQPKIVENKQGLLIDFRLLGSSVNGQPVAPTLNLPLGNMPPGACVMGKWDMITTLSGKFVDFTASFTHASDLGGTLTSLIQSVNTHFLTREMLVDVPGSDSILDYLAYDDPTGDRMPTKIFTSDCAEQPVNAVGGTLTGLPQPGDPSVALTMTPISGWVYTKIADPAEGRIPLVSVVRSDGKQLSSRNFWVSEEKPTGKQSEQSIFFVNVIDYETTGSYALTYETPAADTTAPVTALIVEEPRYGSDPVYITSLTNFLFTATDDISGVLSMLFKLDGGAYEPALPFNLKRLIFRDEERPGLHTIEYYSADRSGNQESPRTMHVFVDDAPPSIGQLTAAPAVIIPAAPASSGKPKTTTLSALATDAITPIDIICEIAAGVATNDATFASLPVVATIPGTLSSGIKSTITWDGRNSNGLLVSAGVYTVRLTAADKLGAKASAFTSVTVNEFLATEVLSQSGADQINPAVSGSRVVWQDYRNGKWDIFLYDLDSQAVQNLTQGKLADQVRPSTDGDYVVWQDRSAGNWDIALYNLVNGSETVIAANLNNDTNPVVNGNRVAYQSGPQDNQDIYLYDITTGLTTRITDAARDQINPSISGDRLVWEDYRHGLGEIYGYDLPIAAEFRVTDNIANQTHPALNGDRVVWVDQRNGNRDLYAYTFANGKEIGLTHTSSDEAQPFISGSYGVYVDYAAGLSNPNLSLMHLASQRTMPMTADPHLQEQPRLSGKRMVWQDNRSGVWQIYATEVTFPLAAHIERGFNVVAITKDMKQQYGNAFGLLTAWKSLSAIDSVYAYDADLGEMRKAAYDASGAPTGVNFTLGDNMALYVEAYASADIDAGELTDCTPLSLKSGLNLAGFACVADGYRASDMIAALGLDAVYSISKFDNLSGRFVTTGVHDGAVSGEDFVIRPGEGYIIYSSKDITNWVP